MHWMRVIPAAACLLVGCHRQSVRTLPTIPPSFAGHVTQRSFARDSTGPGHLYLFGVRRVSTAPSVLAAPEGYFRVDTLTRWAVAQGGRINWPDAGVSQLSHAFVRVWLRGAPTSRTDREIWGRAALVVVDTLGQ
jgi:hypothetical protein